MLFFPLARGEAPLGTTIWFRKSEPAGQSLVLSAIRDAAFFVGSAGSKFGISSEPRMSCRRRFYLPWFALKLSNWLSRSRSSAENAFASRPEFNSQRHSSGDIVWSFQ